MYITFNFSSIINVALIIFCWLFRNIAGLDLNIFY